MINEKLIEKVEEIKVKLLQNKYTISTAESCTGGMLAAYLTSVQGASNYFNMTIVSYSNEAKIKVLKVPTNILEQFGPTSEETAKYMALGIQKISNTHLAIGITGIAGPNSDSENKPVGTVCFGLYINDEVKTYTCYFSGSREQIRYLACEQALNFIFEALS